MALRRCMRVDALLRAPCPGGRLLARGLAACPPLSAAGRMQPLWSNLLARFCRPLTFHFVGGSYMDQAALLNSRLVSQAS